MLTRTVQYTTHGEGDIVDITPDVRKIVASAGIRTGLLHLFVVGSTAAITTIEYEPGVLEDLRDALSRIAPDDIPYAHDNAWGDGNGRSHVKAALVGPSLTVPIEDGNLQTGTWQQIVLLELDIRPTRNRKIICTVVGEA
ncbi:MAG: secondary thiamine-phosphate synthase enzyme YjbQ [Methanoculleaceae archaeon]